MSGREPSTWILREPGIGRVTDPDSCSVCCSRELGTAFMAFVLVGLDEAAARESPASWRRVGATFHGHPAKLPYAGITRIRFQGSVSTGRWPVPPLQAAFDHVVPSRASRAAGCLPIPQLVPLRERPLWERPWPRLFLVSGKEHRVRGRSHKVAGRADAVGHSRKNAAMRPARPATGGPPMPRNGSPNAAIADRRGHGDRA